MERVRPLLVAAWMGIVPLASFGAAEPKEIHSHAGMANASAAAPVTTNLVAVASDEDNRLRLYRTDVDGPAVREFDMSGFLQVSRGSPEADIEAAARIGERIYWLGSHARNREGRLRPNRQRFFATDIVTQPDGPVLRPAGGPCANLLDQLLADPGLQGLGLKKASALDAKLGGINLEGMAATSEGGVLLGFRSPLAGGRALLIPLLNPAEVVNGASARFGEAVQLDLKGLGIRDLAWSGKEYYAVAGGEGRGGRSELFHWKAHQKKPKRINHPGFRHLNPEALALFGDPSEIRVLVLSDDGNRNPLNRAFRSLWVDPH